MKQPQYQPLEVWEMALTLFAVNNNFLDDISVDNALKAEKSMRDYIETEYKDLIQKIKDTSNLDNDDESKLKEAIEKWKSTTSFK
jgi:F-type H+-transporting ATPase subunit alpha